MLSHGQEVGQNLARMLGVSHAADHRSVRVLGHALQVGLEIEASDDRVQIAVENARDVGCRLALPDLDLLIEDGDGVTAQAVDRHFEGDARTVARPLENHPHVQTVERLGQERAGLELLGQAEDRVDIAVGEVRDREQVSSAQASVHASKF